MMQHLLISDYFSKPVQTVSSAVNPNSYLTADYYGSKNIKNACVCVEVMVDFKNAFGPHLLEQAFCIMTYGKIH